MDLTWLNFIMIILASYRLTHLIVFDKITEFIRKPFLKDKKISATETKRVPKSMFGYLLTCYWCTGIWSAILLGILFIFTPLFAKYIIFILAIAGGQAILETFVGVNIKRTEWYNSEIQEK